MYAQLCCCGLDDGRTVKVPDPAPDTWRVLRNANECDEYDEYRRDGITNVGLIRYVRVEHD
jgi:hypothetical protein